MQRTILFLTSMVLQHGIVQFVPIDSLYQNIFICYLLQSATFLSAGLVSQNRVSYFASPCAVWLLYACTSFTGGSYLIARHEGLFAIDYLLYFNLGDKLRF